jgi:hypothetical protein
VLWLSVTCSFGILFGNNASLGGGGGGVAASPMSCGDGSSGDALDATALWSSWWDDDVRCWLVIESSQHEVGRCYPRVGGGGIVCAWWRWSPWWKAAAEVVCFVFVALLGIWVLAMVQWLVVAVLAGVSPPGVMVLLCVYPL